MIKKNITCLLTLLYISTLLISCKDSNFVYDVKEFPDEPAQIISTEFSRGVNLFEVFQVQDTEHAEHIQTDLLNEAVFSNLKELDFDVIRVPMSFDRFIVSGPDYSFQQEFWIQLERLLNLGDEYDMTVIIDNHSWELTETFSSDYAQGFMEKTWVQITEFCKERFGDVVFELKNCPDGDYWKENWGTVQEGLISSIRTIDPSRAIIVSPADKSSISSLPVYEDDNLIYTIHFYKPFIFTHQGLDDYGLGGTGGTVSFPYDPDYPLEVPENIDSEYKNMYDSYKDEGTVSYLERELTKEINLVKERRAKMFISEFGVAAFTGVDNLERAKWYEVVRECIERNNVSWTVSSYTNDFSIFTKDEDLPDFYEDLNIPVIQSLKLPVPEYYDGMENVQLIFGRDEWGNEIVTSHDPGPSGIAEVEEGGAYRGNKTIHWKIGAINNSFLRFNFPPLDLSDGIDDYILQLAIKNSENANKIRMFLWDKQSSGATYRLQYILNLPYTEGDYKIVKIPLSEFEKSYGILPDGSWVDPPFNQFDWSKFCRIQFTVENFNQWNEMTGEEFWIDEMSIRKPKE